MGRIKGAPMREVLRWVERDRGRAGLRELATKLPPEIVAQLDPGAEALGILPSVWYESTVAHALFEQIFGPLPPHTRHAAMRDAAHFTLRATARGVYRAVLSRLVTVGFLASNIQRLWRLVQDDGERVMVPRDHALESVTRAWSGHHPLLCRFMMENTAAILETMGKQDVVVDVRSCVSQGDRECAVVYRWAVR